MTRNITTTRTPPLASIAPRGRLWWGVAILVLALAGGAFAFQQAGAGASAPSLVAERTSYDFGRASMSAGLLKTRFALAVQGSPVVTTVATN